MVASSRATRSRSTRAAWATGSRTCSMRSEVVAACADPARGERERSARCPWAIEVQLRTARPAPAPRAASCSQSAPARWWRTKRATPADRRADPAPLGPQPLYRPSGSQRSAIQAAGKVVQLAAQRRSGPRPRSASAARSPIQRSPKSAKRSALAPAAGWGAAPGKLLSAAPPTGWPPASGPQAIDAATPPTGVADAGSGRHGRSAATAARARA